MNKMKQAKKTIPKASRRRLLPLGTISILFFVFMCFNVFSYTYKIVSLSSQEKQLSAKLDELKTEREQLLVKIDKLHDPDYLARYARETYYYTKNGEYVIKTDDDLEADAKDYNEEIDSTQKTIDTIKEVCSKYKYVIGSCLLFGISFIVIIIKKSHNS